MCCSNPATRDRTVVAVLADDVTVLDCTGLKIGEKRWRRCCLSMLLAGLAGFKGTTTISGSCDHLEADLLGHVE